jgi:succinyl-diaminopimelate desuccinylase
MAKAMSGASARDKLVKRVRASREALVDATIRLVRAPSANPPGDTKAVAKIAAELLARTPGIEVEVAASEPPIVNVIARVRGNGPGRRLVFNGHLDTFPAGDACAWTLDPFGGEHRDGRIYGRGVTDMKGGVACSILATCLLAAMREDWPGEVVVTLAGDEETMGSRGTAWLLEHYPHAAGDAMITGDAGSPEVLRFGEKGILWLELEAEGKAAHGAHVHLGINAIERLMDAVAAILKLRNLPVSLPAEVDRAITEAAKTSEAISGRGESETLRRITVNCGLFRGGLLSNIVPPSASAAIDIRLPAGVSVAEIEGKLAAILDQHEGVRHAVTRRFEPLWTDPQHEVVKCLKRAGQQALGRTPVANYRVGASDARLYRQRKVPAVVCGPTPYHMGAADEYVEVGELCAVHYMHTLAAFDYLMTADASKGGDHE